MCKLHPRTSRYGSSLSHGKAHAADHNAWSRRDFLFRMGVGGAAASFMMGNTPMKAYAQHSMFQPLHNIETDRVLVLIQLTGGNDGLNTVVPISNDIYYQNRPNIAISSNDALHLNNDFGLHPNLAGLEEVWGDGNLGIVHGVGYPDPTLSHFRSTDIWTTGSGADDYLNTGWIGRTMGQSFPNYALNPPDYPLVVQLGNSASVLMQGPVGPMGMNILNDDIFERLAEGGSIYDEQNVPNSIYGRELAFARTISNDSYEYASVISDAMSGASNAVNYPGNDNTLSSSLSQVARMIKGGLTTHIYLVGLGGFDTHTNQETRHGQLMEKLGGAMKAFYDDLNATNDGDRVMMMTFSEFGRRLGQNSSNGTDHGAAAPVIVMGNKVAGGFYEPESDLSQTSAGNVVYSTDFRKVYSSVLRNWLEIDVDATSDVFGGNFGAIPFIEGTSGDDGDPDAGDGGTDGGDGGGDGGNGDGGNGDGGNGDGGNGDGGDGGNGDGGDGGNGDGGNGDGGNGDGGDGGNGDGGDGGGDGGDGGSSVGVGDENVVKFTLNQNYPNPFSGRTSIEFELPTTMRANIAVYDMNGRQVEVLTKGTLQAGRHTVNFNASGLASGIYMCRLTTPLGTAVRRMTVIR